ncbi:MAG: hypothetical protein M0R05_07705 [Bacilli bacterium]|nr:hypothetical protein [Bacilli bacterium]MDD4076854.1 hypothetical protein [Bacilli bacterium]MDD4388968.1 hypothetical protein [Bacilli bacterium]
MITKIKVSAIIDFSRDEKNENRYFFGMWDRYDYWDISFTLIDNTISNISFNDEYENREFVINESFIIDGKNKILKSENQDYSVEFTNQFFQKLKTELAELAEQDEIRKNTMEFTSLKDLISALENQDNNKYYQTEIIDHIMVMINKNKLEDIASERTINDLEEAMNDEEEKFTVSRDENGNYLFLTHLIVNIYVHNNQAQIKSVVDYVFGPIDFPIYEFELTNPDALNLKINLESQNIIEQYEKIILNDILFCESLIDDEDDWSDDDFDDDDNDTYR